ncbi:MAG TPA: TVP38/TMEM64 family protein [Candidatus Eisenbergiella merdavium]|uniref:TVP38/TMEM64 family membrane protein n=1 Tax=Candidatus Eisenbergiella merdavium TaxID=2838551 RepID=A0A9D2SSA1_9FIRM|nr:TVP38/TMEM64 family protein [Candidatus Eisenbergiella merdavium]
MEKGKGTLILTAAGLAACAVFFIYGMKNGLFASEEAMAQFLSGFGIWGPLAFVGLQVVQVVIPIMPGGISCLAGVLLFGPVWGFVYNYVGICIGSALAFQIARKFGMPAVERAAGSQKLGRYLKWVDNGVFDRLFAAAIFFPAAPDDLLCFLAGVTRMRFGRFLLIILLGKPFSIALYSLGLTVIFDRLLGLAG